MLFSLLKHHLDQYVTNTALKVSRSLYCFATSISMVLKTISPGCGVRESLMLFSFSPYPPIFPLLPPLSAFRSPPSPFLFPFSPPSLSLPIPCPPLPVLFPTTSPALPSPSPSPHFLPFLPPPVCPSTLPLSQSSSKSQSVVNYF